MADLLVLCYHAISERWPAKLAVRPSQLAEQLSSLLEKGYAGATFSDAVLRQPPGRTLVVTFDDAYSSVYRLAAPILDQLGLPGTVFVPTGFPDSGDLLAWSTNDQWLRSPFEDELSPMSWTELRKLAESGWEVGSHTRTHPHLTALSQPDLVAELRSSRLECTGQIEAPCRSLAYPFGAVDRRVVEATRSAGYDAAATLGRPGHRTTAAICWPRPGIYRHDGKRRFKLKVSRHLRMLRGMG